MAVVIRLARQGRSHRAFYRITVADSRKAATGKFLAQIGWFDPHGNPTKVQVDEHSAVQWIQNGAQPTESVRSLFHDLGIMDKVTQVRRGKKADEVVASPKARSKRKPKVHKKVREAAAKEAEAAAKAAEAAAKAAAAAPAA